jgi:two-component system LytT family response regulator
MNKYKAYIVDDESDNISLLKYFLKKYCLNIEIIGESETFDDSINDLNILKPQILFLDINLKDKNGFDILDVIVASETEIIFVTAHQEFALKAFKYSAIDYVLKPILIDDLIIAVNKAIIRIEEKIVFDNQTTNNLISSKNNSSTVLTITSLDKIEIVKKTEILFCKSDGRYTTLFLNNKPEILACKNLGEFETQLKEEFFYRIHNSYIVNINYVKNINKKAGFYCEMVTGEFLPIAKRRYHDFCSFLILFKN